MPIRRLSRSVVAGGTVALAAIVVRLPMTLTSRPLGYDDGVYASSVMAMRSGAVPFRDIFSSQGPAFLPTLRFFDVVGLEHSWAPRLAMAAAAAVAAVALYSIALRTVAPAGAAAIGVAGGTAATMILAAGPIQSDGLAIGFATAALAVAAGDHDGLRVPITVGALAALGLATKSLFALPGVVAAVVVLAMQRSRRAAGIAAVTGLVVGLIVTGVYGFEAVWDQYVLFHLRVPKHVDVAGNAAELLGTLGRREIVLMGLVALTLLWRLSGRRPRDHDDRPMIIGGTVWLIGALAVIVFTTDLDSGNRRFVAFVVVPLLVLVAAARIRPWMLVTVVAVLLPFHVAGIAGILDGPEPAPDAGRLFAALEMIPDGSNVVGDIQSITYSAGLGAPAWLTDTSYARVDAGYLTIDDVVAGMIDPDTCAVVLWSGRLASLTGDLGNAAMDLGYTEVIDNGNGHSLLLRPSCRLERRSVLATARPR